MTPLLDLKGIVKTFPSVRALDGIDFTLLPGEVHVLLGQKRRRQIDADENSWRYSKP